jgi:nucleotide-binding universal stress UspA family protein
VWISHTRATFSPGPDRIAGAGGRRTVPDMSSGPVVIGFDGSPAAERALGEAAELLAPRPAIVVVVWEAGRAFDLAMRPSLLLDAPLASLDLRAAFEADQAEYEAAQRLAHHGATLAKESGLDATGLAVADEVTVADTLLRVAEENDAAALVVGRHGHRTLSELLLGSTSRAVVEHAPCPVVIGPAIRS